MGVRLPFLFNMPALAAWPLGFFGGIALLVGLLLVFGGTSLDQPVFVAALFGPVAFVPLIARWKRMSLIRWTAGVVVLAVLQVVLLMIFLHPITVLLAIVFHHPPRPNAAPEPSEPVAEAEEAPGVPSEPLQSASQERPRTRRSRRRRRW